MTDDQDYLSQKTTDEVMSRMIKESRTVAVVGISDKLGRPSLTESALPSHPGLPSGPSVRPGNRVA